MNDLFAGLHPAASAQCIKVVVMSGHTSLLSLLPINAPTASSEGLGTRNLSVGFSKCCGEKNAERPCSTIVVDFLWNSDDILLRFAKNRATYYLI